MSKSDHSRNYGPEMAQSPGTSTLFSISVDEHSLMNRKKCARRISHRTIWQGIERLADRMADQYLPEELRGTFSIEEESVFESESPLFSEEFSNETESNSDTDGAPYFEDTSQAFESPRSRDHHIRTRSILFVEPIKRESRQERQPNEASEEICLVFQKSLEFKATHSVQSATSLGVENGCRSNEFGPEVCDSVSRSSGVISKCSPPFLKDEGAKVPSFKFNSVPPEARRFFKTWRQGASSKVPTPMLSTKTNSEFPALPAISPRKRTSSGMFNVIQNKETLSQRDSIIKTSRLELAKKSSHVAADNSREDILPLSLSDEENEIIFHFSSTSSLLENSSVREKVDALEQELNPFETSDEKHPTAALKYTIPYDKDGNVEVVPALISSPRSFTQRRRLFSKLREGRQRTFLWEKKFADLKLKVKADDQSLLCEINRQENNKILGKKQMGRKQSIELMSPSRTAAPQSTRATPPLELIDKAIRSSQEERPCSKPASPLDSGSVASKLTTKHSNALGRCYKEVGAQVYVEDSTQSWEIARKSSKERHSTILASEKDFEVNVFLSDATGTLKDMRASEEIMIDRATQSIEVDGGSLAYSLVPYGDEIRQPIVTSSLSPMKLALQVPFHVQRTQTHSTGEVEVECQSTTKSSSVTQETARVKRKKRKESPHGQMVGFKPRNDFPLRKSSKIVEPNINEPEDLVMIGTDCHGSCKKPVRSMVHSLKKSSQRCKDHRMTCAATKRRGSDAKCDRIPTEPESSPYQIRSNRLSTSKLKSSRASLTPVEKKLEGRHDTSSLTDLPPKAAPPREGAENYLSKLKTVTETSMRMSPHRSYGTQVYPEHSNTSGSVEEIYEEASRKGDKVHHIDTQPVNSGQKKAKTRADFHFSLRRIRALSRLHKVSVGMTSKKSGSSSTSLSTESIPFEDCIYAHKILSPIPLSEKEHVEPILHEKRDTYRNANMLLSDDGSNRDILQCTKHISLERKLDCDKKQILQRSPNIGGLVKVQSLCIDCVSPNGGVEVPRLDFEKQIARGWTRWSGRKFAVFPPKISARARTETVRIHDRSIGSLYDKPVNSNIQAIFVETEEHQALKSSTTALNARCQHGLSPTKPNSMHLFHEGDLGTDEKGEIELKRCLQQKPDLQAIDTTLIPQIPLLRPSGNGLPSLPGTVSTCFDEKVAIAAAKSNTEHSVEFTTQRRGLDLQEKDAKQTNPLLILSGNKFSADNKVCTIPNMKQPATVQTIKKIEVVLLSKRKQAKAEKDAEFLCIEKNWSPQVSTDQSSSINLPSFEKVNESQNLESFDVRRSAGSTGGLARIENQRIRKESTIQQRNALNLSQENRAHEQLDVVDRDDKQRTRRISNEQVKSKYSHRARMLESSSACQQNSKPLPFRVNAGTRERSHSVTKTMKSDQSQSAGRSREERINEVEKKLARRRAADIKILTAIKNRKERADRRRVCDRGVKYDNPMHSSVLLQSVEGLLRRRSQYLQEDRNKGEEENINLKTTALTCVFSRMLSCTQDEGRDDENVDSCKFD